jgi:hypothetical protein
MIEAYLSSLQIKDLIDLMAKRNEELLELNKFSPNKLAVESKHTEVELIQKIIAAKRSEFSQDN